MNLTIQKVERILKSEYSAGSFTNFICEIFPTVKIIAPKRLNKEYSNFSSHIYGSSHVGTYIDSSGKKLTIHSVRLNKESYVENSRSIQRNYAKKLIEYGEADAAMIAFYTEGDPKWRISFVRLDYGVKFENGRLKTTENMTPARRYSYLVGKDEPCHTAISRFRRFLDDDTGTVQPTIDELEDAFSVEKVTDEFFALYCEKFHQLREALENNPDFVIEAEQHNFTSAQFAKKLMGQIVFLYFLQKKGWLGVRAWPDTLNAKEYKNAYFARGKKSRELIPKVYVKVSEDEYRISKKALEKLQDEDERLLASCVRGCPWGTGSRTFMRNLFEFSEKKHANFFDDYLEPLFYDALNVNRGEQGYDPALHCRIPFLSGGLFEPIDGYDWEHNNFSIPNEIFSNKGSKGEREGDGILDIFDRYNFTMSEDEPMEREVAIDPEMLGKVFENLLEVKDRKSKGAFYTPREIVHYMCQEALIAYLVRETGLKEQDIRDFILYGDLMRDEDTSEKNGQMPSEMFISEEIYKIDSKGKIIVNRLKDLDEALANIRIADPAVGSGAFPLGMLNEIVRARQNISAYMAITMNPYEKRMMYNNERSAYSLKRETIKNCIFAADIEPSAVDIAQLRLWLALVIDDEINPDAKSPVDGHRNPVPLPNLECNIVCGNSLLDKFGKDKLINNSSLIATTGINQQTMFYQFNYDTILPELLKAQDALFDCDDLSHKAELKEKIEALKDELVNWQMGNPKRYANNEEWNRYQATKRLASKPFVLWQMDFAKVFHEKGGFDVIIGNPPYVQLQKEINEKTGEKLGDQYIDAGFETFTRTGDIYCLFYEKGYRLLRDGGILAFITSNKWMRAGYGEKLRGFLAKNTNPKCLIDFSGQKVFTSATVDVNILIFSKEPNEHKTMASIAKNVSLDHLSVFVEHNSSPVSFDKSDSWTILSPIEQSIKRKIEAIGVPLRDWNISINYGIKTGLNEAFIISGEKKDELIKADPKSAEIIRPILRGRDIKRYSYDFADLWLIATFPSKAYDINDYPAVRDHLLSFGIERLEQSGKTYIINGERVRSRKKTNNKWFETQDSISYWDDFSKQKIMYNDICQRLSFSLVEENMMCSNTVYFIPYNHHLKYLLGFLNSNLLDWYYRTLSVQLGEKAVRMFSIYVMNIPIPKPVMAAETEINKIVNERNSASNEAVQHSFDQKLNHMIESLYSLNEEERTYIASVYGNI